MEKTFTNVGVSTLNGVKNLRVCNGTIAARIKVLHADGHTQCAFVTLPSAMTRADAFAWALKNGIGNADATNAVAGVNRTRSELGIGHVARSSTLRAVAEVQHLSAYDSMMKNVADMRQRAELLLTQSKAASDTAAQLKSEAAKLETAASAMKKADDAATKKETKAQPKTRAARKAKTDTAPQQSDATFGALTEGGNAGAVA